MFGYKRKSEILIAFTTMLYLAALSASADTRVVTTFTSTGIQNVINAANDGDTVYLPAGTYIMTEIVLVNKPLTILGSATLQNLGVVELGNYIDSNVNPNWSGEPSRCLASDDQVYLFRVTTNAGVTFRNLKLEGLTTYSAGNNIGIWASGNSNVTVDGCEVTKFHRAIYFSNSRGNLVKNCWIHYNNRDGFGYGVCLIAAQAIIRENEFMANRHDLATNSPSTSFIVYKNYSHDNDDVKHRACFDTHPTTDGIKGRIYRNIFVRTRPVQIYSGSVEISGNYFDVTCGRTNYSAGDLGHTHIIWLAPPTHNNNFISGVSIYNTYIGGNINNTTRPEVIVSSYNYPPTKWVCYNTYLNGVDWAYNNNNYPPLSSSPVPMVGDIYVTLPGTTTRVDSIMRDVWYDLNAMACDPDGADNIARIGIQLRDYSQHAYKARNLSGTFDENGNYFIEATRDSVYVRITTGSSDWSYVPGSTEDIYVDTNHFQWLTAGNNRKHIKIRFKLLPSASVTEWAMTGYTKDIENHVSRTTAFVDSVGWYLTVDHNTGITEENKSPKQFRLVSIAPNPFNPSTTITLDMPRDEYLSLSIYNLLGQEICELVKGYMPSGKHSYVWDGKDTRGQTVSAGIYFTRAEMAGSVETKKMLFLK